MNYCQRVLKNLEERYPQEREFLQAAEEVLGLIQPVLDQHPEYEQAGILERLVEPERIIMFRVPVEMDDHHVEVYRGYRVQFNSALGPYKGGLPFNVEHAAVAAGLAQPSFSNFVVTKEFGPRIQFGCILTDLELEYDHPDSGPRLCDPESCHICADVCPVNALPDKLKTVRNAGRSYEMSDHKVNACTVAALGMRNEFAGKVKRGDLVTTDDPSDTDIAEAMKNYAISNTNLDHYPKSFCNRCQIYCPLGNRKSIFKDKGLSAN